MNPVYLACFNYFFLSIYICLFFTVEAYLFLKREYFYLFYLFIYLFIFFLSCGVVWYLFARLPFLVLC